MILWTPLFLTTILVANGNGQTVPPRVATAQYSCTKIPYRATCSTGFPSQFSLRWFLMNGKCCSYPYGHCKGEDDTLTNPSIRTKTDCEAICIKGDKSQPGSTRNVGGGSGTASVGGGSGQSQSSARGGSGVYQEGSGSSSSASGPSASGGGSGQPQATTTTGPVIPGWNPARVVTAQYSCAKIPFKPTCTTGFPSQLVLRWYWKDGRCCSYPYGHCKGEDDTLTNPSIRTKADCETICKGGGPPAVPASSPTPSPQSTGSSTPSIPGLPSPGPTPVTSPTQGPSAIPILGSSPRPSPGPSVAPLVTNPGSTAPVPVTPGAATGTQKPVTTSIGNPVSNNQLVTGAPIAPVTTESSKISERISPPPVAPSVVSTSAPTPQGNTPSQLVTQNIASATNAGVSFPPGKQQSGPAQVATTAKGGTLGTPAPRPLPPGFTSRSSGGTEEYEYYDETTRAGAHTTTQVPNPERGAQTTTSKIYTNTPGLPPAPLLTYANTFPPPPSTKAKPALTTGLPQLTTANKADLVTSGQPSVTKTNIENQLGQTAAKAADITTVAPNYGGVTPQSKVPELFSPTPVPRKPASTGEPLQKVTIAPSGQLPVVTNAGVAATGPAVTNAQPTPGATLANPASPSIVVTPTLKEALTNNPYGNPSVTPGPAVVQVKTQPAITTALPLNTPAATNSLTLNSAATAAQSVSNNVGLTSPPASGSPTQTPNPALFPIATSNSQPGSVVGAGGSASTQATGTKNVIPDGVTQLLATNAPLVSSQPSYQLSPTAQTNLFDLFATKSTPGSKFEVTAPSFGYLPSALITSPPRVFTGAPTTLLPLIYPTFLSTEAPLSQQISATFIPPSDPNAGYSIPQNSSGLANFVGNVQQQPVAVNQIETLSNIINRSPPAPPSPPSPPVVPAQPAENLQTLIQNSNQNSQYANPYGR